MPIEAFGPFVFNKNKCHDKLYISGQWDAIEHESAGLADACGVYIFSLKNAENFVPVYIGRTSASAGFRRRVFSDDKFRTTMKYIIENKGHLTIHLLVRPKPVQEGFAVISEDDLEYLETFCIMCALRKNENLTNVSKTRFVERILIPGITGNSGQGKPTSATLTLRNIFAFS